MVKRFRKIEVKDQRIFDKDRHRQEQDYLIWFWNTLLRGNVGFCDYSKKELISMLEGYKIRYKDIHSGSPCDFRYFGQYR
jgi:hypothetical protein